MNDVQQVPILKLKNNPNNPRVLRDDRFRKLVRSLKEFPDMLNKRPLVVVTDAADGKYVVLGGNQRLAACRELKYKTVPVIVADEWTPEQREEFVVKDNVSFGDWKWEELRTDWDRDKLSDWGVEMPKEPRQKTEEVEATDEQEINYNDEVMAYKGDAVFPSTNKWGIPDIPLDCIYDGELDDVRTLTGKTVDDGGRYLYVINNSAFNHIDTKRAMMAFYTRDYKFEAVWDEIELYADKFKRMGMFAIVSPNYTLWKHDPFPIRLMRTYKSRWIIRYLSKVGFKVIIDLEVSMKENHEDLEPVLAGLPVGMPWVAIQCQQEIPAEEREHWVSQYRTIFDALKPKKILCYGTKKRDFVRQSFPGYEFVFVPTVNEQLKLQRS